MIFRFFQSFRDRILLSFFAFIGVLLLWISIFYYLNDKEKFAQDFSNRLSRIQERFLESNSHLENFILFGYHQPSFYMTGRQKDIDFFLQDQKGILKDLRDIKSEAELERINLDPKLNLLSKLQTDLIDSVRSLKAIYFLKGFKDFGAEGKMRYYAHLIENDRIIPEKDILQLRRHEKDYLLRSEDQYEKQFNALLDSIQRKFPYTSTQYALLDNYRFNFNFLVIMTNRLGINSKCGTYNQVQNHIQLLEIEYTRTQALAHKEIAKIGDTFLEILLLVSLILMGVIIYLSYFLSDHLTRDITILNQRMFSFINSGFRDEINNQDDERFIPTIKEISHLNRDFVLLKTSLKTTLNRLENSYQEAKQASEYKTTFLANMSHEIRTPLNGVIGMVHLLKGQSLPPLETDYLNTIEFSAGHLLDLINMTLDYSKIEAGKMELDSVAFDLKGDLIKLTKIFEYKVQEKGLEMILDIQVATDHYFIGDPMRVQQILINLLNNAIKFTDKGKVSLIVKEVEPLRQSAKWLKFEIIDSGIGISEGKAERLFEAFNQGDTSISRNFGGTGLGLTISNELVNLMGGNLKYARLTNGSKFSFDLLFEVGDKILHQNKKDSFDPMKFHQPKILLVEDNFINQKVIKLMLSRNNALVDIAENGLEAIDLFANNEYDLVLMDIRMPKMDGLEATRIIRDTERYKKLNTPIVAVTANAFHEDRIRALVVGMDDFLSKPVKPIELEAVLAKYLKKHVHSS